PARQRNGSRPEPPTPPAPDRPRHRRPDHKQRNTCPPHLLPPGPGIRIYTAPSAPGNGSSARTVVPWPGRLVTSGLPPAATIRSARPRSPEPRPGSAPPTPSSRIATLRRPSARFTSQRTRDARAYLATLARASEETKYAAASTGAGSRSTSTASSTGTGARSASALSAHVRLETRVGDD